MFSLISFEALLWEGRHSMQPLSVFYKFLVKIFLHSHMKACNFVLKMKTKYVPALLKIDTNYNWGYTNGSNNSLIITKNIKNTRTNSTIQKRLTKIVYEDSILSKLSIRSCSCIWIINNCERLSIFYSTFIRSCPSSHNLNFQWIRNRIWIR